MTPPPVAQLVQLRTAGEPVREDLRVVGGFPYRGQELVLGAGHRHVVVAAFEAEVSGQAAAAAGQASGEAGAFAEAAVGGVAEDGVLVAVGLAGDGAVDARGLPVGGQFLQGLGESPYGVGQLGGARVVREEFGQVGAEGGGAARFQDDQGVAVLEEGLRTSTVRRMTRRAWSSCPVET